MSDSYELLERVNDRDSLIAFVEAFIAERESAETLESEQPHRYAMGGTLDWQNSDISSFLDGACQFLHHHVQDGDPPTWRMIAEFLWCGKIME
jgi:hypothetical protein